MKKIVAVVMGCICAWNVSAQTTHLTEVSVADPQVRKQGRQVEVSLTLDLSQLEVKQQQSIRLYPVLVANEGEQCLELAPVILEGSTRHRVHQRQKALRGAAPTDGAYGVLRPRETRQQPFAYQARIPYEPWMLCARLVLRERVTGCRECPEGQAESTLLTPILEPYQPQYVLPFLPPVKEEVKRRDEVRVVRLQFRQGSAQVLSDYQQNARELAVVREAVETLKADPVLTVTGIHLTGYASPEGRQSFNQRLSEQRARALEGYLQQHTHTDASLWQVTGAGEDWTGLRAALEAAALPQSAELVQQMDACTSEGDRDAVEPRLRARLGRSQWEALYAPLRCNECRIAYTVKAFTLEEARGLIRTRPELLSADELYAVAQSYEAGSPESVEALQIAARVYPRQVATVVNVACQQLQQGDVKGAIARLEGADPAIRWEAALLNALGVAYARQQQYDQARKVLQQAEAAGSKEAAENLKLVVRVMEEL